MSTPSSASRRLPSATPPFDRMTTPPRKPTLPSSLPSALRPERDLGEVVTIEQVRQQIDARERDIQYHIDALKHEAATLLDDVNVGGRPLMDRIRHRKRDAVIAAAGVGAVVGALLGLRARSKRRVDPEDTVDFIRARLALALDDAAERVAEGSDVETAIRRAMGKMPVAYGEGPAEKPKTAKQEAFSVALTTAVGFGVKMLLDQAAQRITGEPTIGEALDDD